LKQIISEFEQNSQFERIEFYESWTRHLGNDKNWN
jgi:hypothetical protein